MLAGSGAATSLLTLPACSHCPCPHAGKEQRIGNRTEIALLELAMLLGGDPRHLRSQQRQVTQASHPLGCSQSCGAVRAGAAAKGLPSSADILCCLPALLGVCPLQVAFSSERKRMTTACLPPPTAGCVCPLARSLARMLLTLLMPQPSQGQRWCIAARNH